jgi:hypothetical protein
MDMRTMVIAMIFLGLAVVGGGTALLFAGHAAPPPKRPSLAATPSMTEDGELGDRLAVGPGAGVGDGSVTLRRGRVEHDAATFGVPVPDWASFTAAFPYFSELEAPRRLGLGASLETGHLRLSVSRRREQGAELGAMTGQSFRADHLVLRIENLTGHHLAYRVSTRVSDPRRCAAKGALAHNAIALEPHETVFRTECLLQDAPALVVEGVEVMEIPALSYVYVSRLEPALVLYDPRTADGHTIPRGGPCPPTVPWRELRDAAGRGGVAWRDIIDFYARNNCTDRTFTLEHRYGKPDRTGPP